MLVDYNDAIETSTGGRAEFVAEMPAGDKGPLFRVRIFEPFVAGYRKPAPGGVIWVYTAEGFWNNGDGHEIRIVNSARPNDNVPEKW